MKDIILVKAMLCSNGSVCISRFYHNVCNHSGFCLITAPIRTDVFTKMIVIARVYLLCIWFLEFLTAPTSWFSFWTVAGWPKFYKQELYFRKSLGSAWNEDLHPRISLVPKLNIKRQKQNLQQMCIWINAFTVLSSLLVFMANGEQ